MPAKFRSLSFYQKPFLKVAFFHSNLTNFYSTTLLFLTSVWHTSVLSCWIIVSSFHVPLFPFQAISLWRQVFFDFCWNFLSHYQVSFSRYHSSSSHEIVPLSFRLILSTNLWSIDLVCLCHFHTFLRVFQLPFASFPATFSVILQLLLFPWATIRSIACIC